MRGFGGAEYEGRQLPDGGQQVSGSVTPQAYPPVDTTFRDRSPRPEGRRVITTYPEYARAHLGGAGIMDFTAGSPITRRTFISEAALATAREIPPDEDPGSAHVAPVRVYEQRGGDANILRQQAAKNSQPVNEIPISQYFRDAPSYATIRAAVRSMPATDEETKEWAERTLQEAVDRVAKRTLHMSGRDVRVSFSLLADMLTVIRNADELHNLLPEQRDALRDPQLLTGEERTQANVQRLADIQSHIRQLHTLVTESDELYPDAVQTVFSNPQHAHPQIEIVSVPKDADLRLQEAFAASFLSDARNIRQHQLVIFTDVGLVDPVDLGRLRTSVADPDDGTRAIYMHPLDSLEHAMRITRGDKSSADLIGKGADVIVFGATDNATARWLAEFTIRNGLHPTGVNDETGSSIETGKNVTKGEGSSETNSGGVTRTGGMSVPYGIDAHTAFAHELLPQLGENVVIAFHSNQISGPLSLIPGVQLPPYEEPRVPAHVRQAYQQGLPPSGTKGRPVLPGTISEAELRTLIKQELKGIDTSPPKEIRQNVEGWLRGKYTGLARSGAWKGSRNALIKAWKTSGLPDNNEGLTQFLAYYLDQSVTRTGTGLVYGQRGADGPAALRPRGTQPALPSASEQRQGGRGAVAESEARRRFSEYRMRVFERIVTLRMKGSAATSEERAELRHLESWIQKAG